MNTLTDLAKQHPFGLLFAFWTFSNFVSTMPSPDGGSWTSSLFYKWLFNFLHAMSGTIGRILAQYPSTKGLTGQQVIPPPEGK